MCVPMPGLEGASERCSRSDLSRSPTRDVDSLVLPLAEDDDLDLLSDRREADEVDQVVLVEDFDAVEASARRRPSCSSARAAGESFG